MMPRPFWKLTIVTALASLSLWACIGGPTKRITIPMSRRPGGIRQADRLSLHFQKGSVDCSLNFYSEASEKYIGNFGSAPVPVAFDVVYTSGGKPLGATLVRVGKWRANKFQLGEQALATTQKLELGKPGMAKALKIDSPGGCFDPSSSLIDKAYFSIATILPLLLSCANLGLVVVAFLHRGSQPESASGQAPKWETLLGNIGLTLAASSQVLFMAYLGAGLLRWVRFYPGNPLQTYAISAGVILSLGAFFAAPFGSGLKRIAGVLVAVTTAGLWFLAAVASVAV